MIDWDEVAKVAYSAYCESVGGIAFNGDQLPTWAEQKERSPRIAGAWIAAVKAAVEAAT
jgi:hypothetical protein